MKTIVKYLLIVAIILGFSAGAVSASELAEHDFNGEFTALSPVNLQYEEENGFGFHSFVNEANKIAYIYITSKHINDDNVNYIYSILESIGLEKVNNTGNLTIFKANEDNGYVYGVGVYKQGEYVCITGDNLEELEKIGESVKFN